MTRDERYALEAVLEALKEAHDIIGELVGSSSPFGAAKETPDLWDRAVPALTGTAEWEGCRQRIEAAIARAETVVAAGTE